jgi:hypothetical protein
MDWIDWFHYLRPANNVGNTEYAIVINHTIMKGPKKVPIILVPWRWKKKSRMRIKTVIGNT